MCLRGAILCFDRRIPRQIKLRHKARLFRQYRRLSCSPFYGLPPVCASGPPPVCASGPASLRFWPPTVFASFPNKRYEKIKNRKTKNQKIHCRLREALEVPRGLPHGGNRASVRFPLTHWRLFTRSPSCFGLPTGYVSYLHRSLQKNKK